MYCSHRFIYTPVHIQGVCTSAPAATPKPWKQRNESFQKCGEAPAKIRVYVHRRGAGWLCARPRKPVKTPYAK